MNNIEYRKRTFKDDMNSILHKKADINKNGKTIILPEQPINPLIFWKRDDSNSLESEKYKPEKIDDMILKCITWPSKTTSLCHHCCHNFDTVPIPIPETYDHLRKIYICKGSFCSWQCAKAYNIYNTSRAGCGNRNMNIAILAHKMWIKYQKTDDQDKDHLIKYSRTIKPARNKNELKVFGGKLSIEEFREGFFGIVPPEKANTGKPFLNIRQELALPFVDGESIIEIKPVDTSSNLGTGIKNDNLRNMRKTQRMETSEDHEDSNRFCDLLNRAKGDSSVMKRKAKNPASNNLLSSMGVTISKKIKH